MAPAASSRAATHHSVTVSFGPMVVRQRRRRRRWLRWVAVAVSIALLVYLQLCLHARLQAAMDSQPRAPPAPNAVAEVVAEATATAAPQALSAAAVGGGSAGRVPAAGQIPMLVHQSWRDDGFPKDMFNFRWQEAILALNPGWKLMRWTDATSRQLIADDFPWFLSAYDAYPSYIQRCDAARYFIMYSHGGLYADLDYECTKPFAPVLGDARAVFSHKQGVNASRGLVNAIFASEARHPLWRTVFQLMLDRANASATGGVTHVDIIHSTGPGLLRAALYQLDADHAATTAATAATPPLGRRLAAPGGPLAAMGVHVLDSATWHPTMPEQKRGRDSSEETTRVHPASSCNLYLLWLYSLCYTHYAVLYLLGACSRPRAVTTTSCRVGWRTTSPSTAARMPRGRASPAPSCLWGRASGRSTRGAPITTTARASQRLLRRRRPSCQARPRRRRPARPRARRARRRRV